MARNHKHDILFEPIRIGPKTLRNRFYQVPQCTGLGSERPGAQAFNRAIKAEGGWAAMCTEACAIHPDSDDSPQVAARLWDDGDIRNLAAMTDMVHQYDSLAGVELWWGMHAPTLESRHTRVAPSQTSSGSVYDVYPHAMDKADIRQLQQYYVDAALRARTAGFDIIYLYGSHSQGAYQFLSPVYNRRTDEYGGSFENRARFWRDTLEMLKEAVGDDCAIASRFSVDSLGQAGIDVEDDGIHLIEYCDDLVDLWDLNIGTSAEWGQDAGPSRFLPENHEAPFISKIKGGGHTKKPVVGVGRFTNPDTMADAIRSGQLDIIGAARPSIADPFLPKKIEEGRLEDIRECIGCNACIARWEIGTPIVCTQNATQGEEYRRGWHPEKFRQAKDPDKAVLIVGAGPAGMECAMVLGKRGMSAVHLVDAGEEIGGHLRWVSTLGHSDGKSAYREQARGLSEWHRIIDYRQIQLEKLQNVEVITNTRLSADEIRDYGAEIVIVATGCSWARDGYNPETRAPIPGADPLAEWQLTPDEVALGSKPIGHRVLILENESYYMGVSLAQKLAGQGHDVTLVTPHSDIAQYMEYTLESPMMRRELARLGVKIHPSTMVEQLNPGSVRTYNVWDKNLKTDFQVDSVVLCTSRISNDSIYRDLRGDSAALEAAGIEQLHVIGDASSPRMIADSIFDGHRLGREIDSPNPAVPLPFIRERRLWGESSMEDYENQLRAVRDGAPVSEPGMPVRNLLTPLNVTAPV